jgi:ABC-2 type transport system ATP-binding protein
MASVIKIKNLTKYYGKSRGVEDLTFEVNEGEIFGFLGPNGAGKTTTISCIMDFIRPTSGSINVLGMDSTRDSVNIKKRVGFLAGDVSLYEKMSGKEHLKYIESFRGKSPIVKELIKKFEFNPNVKVKNLSKGNKQKLALILALMHKPKILIMDEPTSGLDPLLQNEVYKILENMRKDGSTIFFSSHIISEVERIADRVGIIRNGKLSNIETIEDLSKKKIRNIEIRLNGQYDISDFKVDGVKSIEKINGGISLKFAGDINPLIRKLSSYDVGDIEISHASLEDIFLEFYNHSK